MDAMTTCLGAPGTQNGQIDGPTYQPHPPDRQLKADEKETVCDPGMAMPRLTHMHKLYEKTNLAGYRCF